MSRLMKCSFLTEEKHKNQLAQTKFHFTAKKYNKNKGGRAQLVLRLHISVALQQKTANFKVAILSRIMKCSFLTEEKRQNQLAQTKFHFTTKNDNKNKVN